MLLYISPQSSCGKIKGVTQSMTHSTFQRFRLVSQILVLLIAQLGRSGTITHPKLRKGRRRLFIPFKDNNAGKELSAASISWWICTTIVDSHAYLQNSKSIPGKVKTHEVHAVATNLQLFNKVDLQAVMKAGRLSSGGTFMSSYLRDLSPQALPRSQNRQTPSLICIFWFYPIYHLNYSNYL